MGSVLNVLWKIWDKFELPTTRPTHIKRSSRIMNILSTVLKIANILSTSTSITNYTLTDIELRDGCKAGLDTWADTCCVGKHAHVREVLEGKVANANGFANNLPTVMNIHIEIFIPLRDDYPSLSPYRNDNKNYKKQNNNTNKLTHHTINLHRL